MDMPSIVLTALQRATDFGFTLSSELGVGKLLAVLSASVKRGGRILEIGTGVGVGTAWIVAGLQDRQDVEVITIELDTSTADIAKQYEWPHFVSISMGNVLDMYSDLGTFDLIFADAQGGKWVGLEQTISALKPGGMLLVDDMTPAQWGSEHHEMQTQIVRKTLLSHPELISCEMPVASGIILSSKLYR